MRAVIYTKVCLLLLLPLTSTLCPDSCLLAERQSLQLFYKQTGGVSWTASQGWTLENSGLQLDGHCSWYGVACCSSSGQAVTGHGSLPCGSPGAVIALVMKMLLSDQDLSTTRQS